MGDMNKRIKYSDNEIATKTQRYYIKVAGFTIKIVLEPTEQIIFKRHVVEAIQKTWRKGGFLKITSSTKIDFEIRFTSVPNQMGIIEKNNGKDHYYLALRRDFASRKIIAFYFTSLPVLQILMREILSFLVEKDGFLLHASSCQDKKGNLKLFLAPSGGGKTTTANLLSKGRFCMKFSDDLLIIRRKKGKWFFFSPPLIEKGTYPVEKKAKSAEMYFVKKSDHASKEPLMRKNKILKTIINQIWVRSEKLEKKTLVNAMSFVAENEFYLLKATLNAKVMQKLLYEN